MIGLVPFALALVGGYSVASGLRARTRTRLGRSRAVRRRFKAIHRGRSDARPIRRTRRLWRRRA